MKSTAFHAIALLIATSFPLMAQEDMELSLSDCNAIYKTTNRGSVSVHDPSVVQASGATFYAIGSHRGWATSTDNMQNWRGLDGDKLFGKLNSNGTAVACAYADAFSVNATTKVTALVNGQAKEVDFGPFDAKAWAHADQANWDITGNMWAPDLIYNPNTNKWMMYMSLNGDNWHSVIVLLTADKITGPYVYQGPVHYSGFINGTNAAINWKKTDLEVVLGSQSSLPSRYNKGGDWGTWWTNDIDPCVFFDEEGELWMTYGSWSGGIFMLELDEATGLRDYDVSYGISESSDPYFGKKIAGGYYASGEASYVEYIGGYYFLFVTNGGLEAAGGYQMRVFRSLNPDGPYVDSKGATALLDKRYMNYGPTEDDGNRGVNIFGAYNNWGYQTVGNYGERSQGHNSIIAAPDGRTYLVYHTRFQNQGEGHEVRVHQVFQNQDGWLVACPFEYTGEGVKSAGVAAAQKVATGDIPGTYKLLVHPYGLDHTVKAFAAPVEVELHADGTISGAETGTWTVVSGTSYVTITLASGEYRGVMVPQTLEPTDEKAPTFTALCSQTGVTIWGYKYAEK